MFLPFSVMADKPEYCNGKHCESLTEDTAIVYFSDGTSVPLSVILENVEQDECKRKRK